MAGCKKKVKQKECPSPKHVKRSVTPESFYSQHPSWIFNYSDSEKWALTHDCVGDAIWTEIIPYLKALETQSWSDILIGSKKQNHSIDVEKLNPIAKKRLSDMYVEQEALISLRLSGTHRIYGYMVDSAFAILWYDAEHGDNDTCVCRSTLSHS